MTSNWKQSPPQNTSENSNTMGHIVKCNAIPGKLKINWHLAAHFIRCLTNIGQNVRHVNDILSLLKKEGESQYV